MSAQLTDDYAETILGLHDTWEPHDGQWQLIEDIFLNGIMSAFLRCGRKWGKTEMALYCLWRTARQFPNSPCYYFAPQQNQARGIIWEDPRAKNFGPRDWLLPGSRGISESDMVLRFKNGSFIKIDGTDNYNKYRGVRYKMSVYDEYKDSDPRMRKSMRPNAAVLNAVDIYMGSPPDVTGTDYQMLDKEHKTDREKRAYHQPTWKNPHISRKWLFDEKTRLYKRGEGDEWEREYGAKYVKGGAKAIFPMVDESMIKPHDQIIEEIRRDVKKLKWYWWADPAGATCFAVLFVAINPYNKKVYVLDEIYEKDQREMTTLRIGERTIAKRNELNGKTKAWRQGYDEAATWFNNEWVQQFPTEEALEPSHKAKKSKVDGLSLIKEIMLQDLLVISDRCTNFYAELDGYVKDKNGKIPKEDDHLIDDLRYILGAEWYELNPKEEYREEADEDFRGEALVFSDDNEYDLD